jgi:hypothetical protein
MSWFPLYFSLVLFLVLKNLFLADCCHILQSSFGCYWRKWVDLWRIWFDRVISLWQVAHLHMFIYVYIVFVATDFWTDSDYEVENQIVTAYACRGLGTWLVFLLSEILTKTSINPCCESCFWKKYCMLLWAIYRLWSWELCNSGCRLPPWIHPGLDWWIKTGFKLWWGHWAGLVWFNFPFGLVWFGLGM